MIERSPNLGSDGHVIAIRVSGKVESEDVTAAADAIDSALKDHDRVSVLADVDAMDGFTAEAALKDVGYGLGKIGNLDRFHRVAVVSDKEWMRRVTEWENRLVPKVEVRAFGTAEKSEAAAWVAELPPEPEPHMEPIATDTPGVLAFASTGILSKDDVARFVPPLQSAFEEHGKVRLFLRITGKYGMKLGAFSEDLFKVKLDAMKHVERYAIVGGPSYVKGVIRFFDPLFKIEMRHFEPDDEAAAWEWLGARPLASPSPSQ